MTETKNEIQITSREAPKIGVYVCHCGENIAGVIDVEDVRQYAEGLAHVSVARRNLFMCSDPGQEMIRQDIRDGLVDRPKRRAAEVMEAEWPEREIVVRPLVRNDVQGSLVARRVGSNAGCGK